MHILIIETKMLSYQQQFCQSVKNGNIESFRELLTHNRSNKNLLCFCLKEAVNYGHKEIANEIFQVIRTDSLTHLIFQSFNRIIDAIDFLEKLKAREEDFVDIIRGIVNSTVNIKGLNYRNYYTNCEPILNVAISGIRHNGEVGYIEGAEMLIKNGCNLKQTGSNYDTALHWAVRVNNTKGVKLLIESGCEINTKNNTGNTPLHTAIACKENNIDVVKLLIESGCTINAQNNIGDTPLHIAIEYERSEIFDELLEKQNINCKISNYFNITPITLASKHGNVHMMQALYRKGCNPNQQLSILNAQGETLTTTSAAETAQLHVDQNVRLAFCNSDDEKKSHLMIEECMFEQERLKCVHKISQEVEKVQSSLDHIRANGVNHQASHLVEEALRRNLTPLLQQNTMYNNPHNTSSPQHYNTDNGVKAEAQLPNQQPRYSMQHVNIERNHYGSHNAEHNLPSF